MSVGAAWDAAPHRDAGVTFLEDYKIIVGRSTVSSTSTEEGHQAGDQFLLTIFLKHNQEMTLEEIGRHLSQTGFWQHFPPPGIEVASWYVMMGIGQVVTLQVPPARLREVNLAIEKYAWGAFKTEFYPTYDFKDIWPAQKEAALNE